MRSSRMVTIVFLTAWALSFGAIAAAQLTPPGPSAGGTPAIFFPEKNGEFPPVIDGAKVTHDFPVANKGTVPLQINEVRTG
jgi:hypothetical protein